MSYASGGRHQPRRLAIDGETVSIRTRSRLSLDGGEALRDAAISAAGLAYLPTYLVKEDLAEGRLRRVLADFISPAVPISALYPRRRHLAPKVRRFIDLATGSL